MAIKKPKKQRKVVVNLDGPDGNAFVLRAYAKKWCEQTGDDWKELDDILTSGDYKHLVKTLDKMFGDYVDFETNQKDLLS